MTGPDDALLNVPEAEPLDDPGFVTRRSVMPPGNAWGGTAAQQAHMDATCRPATCRHCADAQDRRGDTPWTT